MDENTTNRSLAALAKGIRVAMLTTEQTGELKSRPLTVQRIDDDVVWFLVGGDADWLPGSKARGNLALVDDKVWISLSGTAVVSRDRAIIEDLGDPVSDAWFTEGTEPAALRFDVAGGEWWESPGMVRAVVGLIKAKATDEQPNVGSHGNVG